MVGAKKTYRSKENLDSIINEEDIIKEIEKNIPEGDGRNIFFELVTTLYTHCTTCKGFEDKPFTIITPPYGNPSPHKFKPWERGIRVEVIDIISKLLSQRLPERTREIFELFREKDSNYLCSEACEIISRYYDIVSKKYLTA